MVIIVGHGAVKRFGGIIGKGIIIILIASTVVDEEPYLFLKTK